MAGTGYNIPISLSASSARASGAESSVMAGTNFFFASPFASASPSQELGALTSQPTATATSSAAERDANSYSSTIPTLSAGGLSTGKLVAIVAGAALASSLILWLLIRK